VREETNINIIVIGKLEGMKGLRNLGYMGDNVKLDFMVKRWKDVG
jgi:hypothetical protein